MINNIKDSFYHIGYIEVYVLSEFEQKALESLNKNGKNVYGNEELGGKKYFTAVYPDVAVSKACVTCHNDHIDSPKKDFKVGEMMGGLVIRIPLD